MTQSWVYLISKFTPEALLFEAMIISTLCAGYAAFWVLRKRRLGVLRNSVPVGVVKGYLNELIFDAEQMRAQLFGLLGGGPFVPGTAPAQTLAQSPVASLGAIDPSMLQKIQMLESKMTEQTRAMDSIVQEKTKLEKDLAAAKAAGKSADGNNKSSDLSDLQNKIHILEGKLAEYSIIEDDLANLKRLQQENAALKAQLAAMGGGVAAPAPASTAPSKTLPEPELPEVRANAAVPTPPASESLNENMAESLVEALPADQVFEGLVDQVEQSLQPDSQSAPPIAEPATPVLQPATLSASEKSDADLVEEFEKMLNA